MCSRAVLSPFVIQSSAVSWHALTQRSFQARPVVDRPRSILRRRRQRTTRTRKRNGRDAVTASGAGTRRRRKRADAAAPLDADVHGRDSSVSPVSVWSKAVICLEACPFPKAAWSELIRIVYALRWVQRGFIPVSVARLLPLHLHLGMLWC